MSVPAVATGVAESPGPAKKRRLPRFWLLQPIYWFPLIIMLFSRRRGVDLACLSILIVGYLVAAIPA